MLKENKGITLVALVITIIVLLILATVSIVAISGDNGILTNVDRAKNQNTKATLLEGLKLAISEVYMERYDGDSATSGEFEANDLVSRAADQMGISASDITLSGDTVSYNNQSVTLTITGTGATNSASVS